MQKTQLRMESNSSQVEELDSHGAVQDLKMHRFVLGFADWSNVLFWSLDAYEVLARLDLWSDIN